MGGKEVAKKNGNVRLIEFKAERFLKQVEKVANRLHEDYYLPKFERKNVALLLANILQFMEDALGKNALPPRPYAKLPAKLFRDYSDDGPVYIIAAKCHEICIKRGLEKLEWQNPARREQSLEVLSALKNELEKQGKLVHPKIYIQPDCGDTESLKSYVKNLGGLLASSAGSAGVTHIVCPFGPNGDPDDGQQYLRSLERRDGGTFVHWWYLPDSYDEWISSGTAPESLEPDHGAFGPWKVYVRWLKDSHKYNEWMNPIDYETEVFQEEQETFRKEAKEKQDLEDYKDVDDIEVDDSEVKEFVDQEGDGQGKRKRDGNNSDSIVKYEENKTGEHERESKRTKPEEPRSQCEVDSLSGKRVGRSAAEVKAHKPERVGIDVTGTVEDISQGQQPQPIPNVSLACQVPQAQAPVDAVDATGTLVPPDNQKEMYRVPAYACWFDWNKINDLERQLIPEFFNGRSSSKTPKAYKEYRAFIINKYRENPERRLNFTEIRRLLAGDVNGIYRVFNFLDNWGLINYMARDSSKDNSQVEVLPLPGGPIPSKLTHVEAAPTTAGLFQFSNSSPWDAAKAATKGFNSPYNLITKKSHFNGTAKDPSAAPVQFKCSAMPWVDCTALRYHCTTIPDVDLCPQAFAEGRFPPGTSAKDFVRIDQSAAQSNSDGWTNQETLLLLEAIELYNDNWSEVAEHVGTKSQLQCIMYFLQMPIEDQFMDQMTTGAPRFTPKVPDEGDIKAETEDPIPFGDTNNPVMAQVAFLAAMVGPKVAAAAAQRALEVLSEDDPSIGETTQSIAIGDNYHQIPGSADSSKGVSSSKMRVAAATALSAAAVKAKLMAEQEEREIQRLVVTVVDSQLKKLEAKLKYSEELDKALEQERLNLRASRQRVDLERQHLRQMLNKAAGIPQSEAQIQLQSLAQTQVDIKANPSSSEINAPAAVQASVVPSQTELSRAQVTSSIGIPMMEASEKNVDDPEKKPLVQTQTAFWGDMSEGVEHTEAVLPEGRLKQDQSSADQSVSITPPQL